MQFKVLGGKFNIFFDATHTVRVAQKTQIDQKGRLRFRIADFFQDTSSALQSANMKQILRVTILRFL
jgi:hypothetical protein